MILISPIPAIVIKEPSTIGIFQLLEQGEYERKNQEEGVIWFMVLESIIHESLKDVLKAFNACEIGGLPDCSNEQVLEEDGVSRVLKKYRSLSISLLNSFGSWNCFYPCGVAMLTCPWLLCCCCPPLFPHSLLDGFPCSFQHISLVCCGFL